jgi:hypothetical protein
MNFILRDKLGFLNRTITESITEINEKKELILHDLRTLHKKPLMNPNIPRYEINVMEGNRENYIKRISHFITNIDMPKNYLDAYDYCLAYSKNMEQLFKDVQKNIFVLNNFFENEIKTTNRDLNKLEEIIINIRATFEKNNIETLKNISQKIKNMTKNIIRIKSIKQEIIEQQETIKTHQEKLDKLKERVNTIISGSEYRVLEDFKNEKEKAENEIKEIYKQIENEFSHIEHALKKYFYKNQDKKILKDYFDNFHETFIKDHNMEFAEIIKDLKLFVENNSIELKNHKKETTLAALDKLTHEFLSNLQKDIHKLEEVKSHAQTKITHNSASLNLSEQQYWINATEDKIKQHQLAIEKFEKEAEKFMMYNNEMKDEIKEEIEQILKENIIIKDDLQETLNENNEINNI